FIISSINCLDTTKCKVINFFFSSRRRHTRFSRDWSSDVCSSDLGTIKTAQIGKPAVERLPLSDPQKQAYQMLAECCVHNDNDRRSEERRVGKECRCRRPPYH